MTEIVLFQNQIELEKFLVFQSKKTDQNFFVIEDFLSSYIDVFENKFEKKFLYKKFKQVEFDLFFHQMLTILIDLDLDRYLNFFQNQKNQIQKIFDDFFVQFSDFFERKEGVENDIDVFFNKIEFRFVRSNFDSEIFKICKKVFFKLFESLLSKKSNEKKIIYKKHFEICIIRFLMENFEIFDFDCFFSRLNGVFRQISLYEKSSFEDFLKKKLSFQSFFGFC